MKYINNILIFILCGLIFSQESWNMSISIDDIQGIGASDQITLGMCGACDDSFRFGEDEYDVPPPPGYYTDISFFNFDWLETSDENGNICDNPEFSVDKRSFHDPIDLLIWEVSGLTNLNDESNNLQMSWSIEELSEDYGIFLYIGSSSYNMRNTNSVIISQNDLEVSYNPASGEFSPNIRIVVGGCAELDADSIAEYYYDQDGDGLGFGLGVEFCTGKAPDGWVDNDSDINDEIYCESNIIDQCDDCDGINSCIGCSDIEACNYSDLVIVDDGSCYYADEYYDCVGNCFLDTDADGICNDLEILGCTDSVACNYDLNATEDDGSCEYPLEYYNCDGACITDVDVDGICDEEEVFGCTNPSSCFFNSEATEYDGSCCQNNDPDCLEIPGQITDLNVDVDLNSVTIDWERPCGVDDIWTYRLLEDLGDSGDVIPYPFTIEGLDWGTNYNYYLKTINNAGFSITEINFTTANQELPGDIDDLTYESLEGQILISWSSSENSSSYNIYKNGENIDNVDGQSTSYLDDNVTYDPDIYYNYMVKGVNSQGIEGNSSSEVDAQAVFIPVVENWFSNPSPGSISFSWENPDSYASNSDYSFNLYGSDGILIEEDYDDFQYMFSNLDSNEEVCLGIQSVHFYGRSSIEWICGYPNLPYPSAISGVVAIGDTGFVQISWDMIDEFDYLVNIYRDSLLIASNLNQNIYFDSLDIKANQEYRYELSTVNSDFLESEQWSEPVVATTVALPVVDDLIAQSGESRIDLEWSELYEYAGYGYIYQIIDQDGEVIDSTINLYKSISGLSSQEEYCFSVRASSLGGYGISGISNEVCGIPEPEFDGTEGDNDIDWGVQLSLELSLPGGGQLVDTQNMLGVALDASDDCDVYDVPELTDTPNDWAKLHFPHQDWDCALVAGTKYNNDIRAQYLDSLEIKEWDVKLETNSWSDGIATVSFHFYQNPGKAVYYTIDNNTYIEINNGDRIEYGLINPVFPGEFKVIVGNIKPEAPVISNFSNSEHRAVYLEWLDGYVPGSLQYKASSYNIYRDGQLVGNTQNTFFSDRGLDPSTDYQYTIQGVNIAGAGDLSEFVVVKTLDNQSPIPEAGVDLVLYDIADDDMEIISFRLPMVLNVDSQDTSLLIVENKSSDPDNYSSVLGTYYTPPLDDLIYTWKSSSDDDVNSEIYDVQIEGYGVKEFALEVYDGFSYSDYNDIVNIRFEEMPAPAKVSIDTSYIGLYSIDLKWPNSRFTGEPYVKSDIDSELFVWEEGDYYKDENNNGVYDSGLNPLPAFYGLSNLNNLNPGPNDHFRYIAEYYEIKINGLSVGEVVEPCFGTPPNTELSSIEFCYTLDNLEPNTDYNVIISSCNFNNICSESEINVSTGDKPYVEVVSPNGSEIIGMQDFMEVELDFGPNSHYIDSLYLSIVLEESSIWEGALFPSENQDILNTSYLVPIDALEYNSTLNSNSKIEVRIVDEGGVSDLLDYSDDSDNSFIISSNNITQNFDNGWHLIGTPVVLDTTINMQQHINSGINFNNDVYWQIVDESETVIGALGPSYDEEFKSGKGYYFKLYSGIPGDVDFARDLSLSGDVVTEYVIDSDSLHVGWNLISNPMVISMNIDSLYVIDGLDTIAWSEANARGLVAPYLLEFEHTNNTLVPSYQIDPYKGYWLYLHDAVGIEFKNRGSDDSIDNQELNLDFTLDLYSNAFGQSPDVFGDFIQLGYDRDASNEFTAGVDIPNLDYQYFSKYTSMYIVHDDSNSEHSQLSRDIREGAEPGYVWNIVGLSQAIFDSDINPDSEVELSWDVSDTDSNHIITLEYGPDFDNQTNMKEFNYVKLNQSQFANMRVVVNLQNYFSGCFEPMACNYFCKERPWECIDGLPPSPFVDDNSCDFVSCVGCMESTASNYNPNASVDMVCSGGENNGFSCMDDAEICGDNSVCVEQLCEFNESYLFQLENQEIYLGDIVSNTIPIYLTNYDTIPVYGIQIELNFDPSVINLAPVSPVDLYNSNSIIEGYSSLSYVTDGIFYFIAYPINNNIALDGGLVFDLQIEPIGNVGDTASIVFEKSILNDTDILSNKLNLTLVDGAIDLSGDVGYYSNVNFPIESAEFQLIGYSDYNNPYNFSVIDTISTASSSSGAYVFDSALKGSYMMKASKVEAPGSDDGLSAVDASRIARSLINLIEFNQDQELAADVDMNGSISAVDAAFIARYLIGLTDQLNDFGQHWRFRSEEDFYLNIVDSSTFSLDAYNLRPLESDLDNQNIVGIRIGDVDGSWISDVQARELDAYSESRLTAHPDESLRIPIGFSSQGVVEGVEFDISYDSENLFFNNFKLKEGFEGYNVIINDSVLGELSVIVYANHDPENSENIFGEILFEFLDEDIKEATINISEMLVNGRNVYSGFQVFDESEKQYIYSRNLSISTSRYPSDFKLASCYPNPFNPSTQIPFSIPIKSEVNISVYDISGRFVKSIISKDMDPGNHAIEFNGKDLASGVYIVRMYAQGISDQNKKFTQSNKVLLLK